MRALISGWWRSCSMSWISWSLSWFWTVFLSLIPTVFSDVAKFVHFILQKSSLFSHPLSSTPWRTTDRRIEFTFKLFLLKDGSQNDDTCSEHLLGSEWQRVRYH